MNRPNCPECYLGGWWNGTAWHCLVPNCKNMGMAFEVPKRSTETIKVRIAVAVNAKGKWEAAGGDNYSESWIATDCRNHLSGESCVVWVEAEVPVPVEQTVQGEVVG